MIIGLGTDIVDISRVASAMQRYGGQFMEHTFTPAESAEGAGRVSYFAGRWAAKEAAAKALGCGIGEECSFTDIEVLDDDSGAPQLTCSALRAKRLEKQHPLRWHVSISHEKQYAVATVIVETLC